MVEISLIPKKEKKPTTLGSIVFISFIAALILTVSFSAGLFFYKRNLQDKLQKLTEIQEELQGKRDKEFEKTVLELSQDIEDARNLLNLHLAPSKIFKILEDGIHPRVQFLSASIDFTKQSIAINAVAENFGSLDGQMDILKKIPEMEKTEVSGISLEKDGRINFNLNIFLPPPQFLKHD